MDVRSYDICEVNISLPSYLTRTRGEGSEAYRLNLREASAGEKQSGLARRRERDLDPWLHHLMSIGSLDEMVVEECKRCGAKEVTLEDPDWSCLKSVLASLSPFHPALHSLLNSTTYSISIQTYSLESKRVLDSCSPAVASSSRRFTQLSVISSSNPTQPTNKKHNGCRVNVSDYPVYHYVHLQAILPRFS